MKISVFDYIEDYDDSHLDFPQWLDHMIEAVQDYNDEFGTMHNPQSIVAQYTSMARKQRLSEPTE